MKVAVWDTYVTRQDGRVMNFDIMVPESETDDKIIYAYGRQYLATKGLEDHPLTTKECSYCHVEIATDTMIADIQKKGYSIVEIKNCQ